MSPAQQKPGEDENGNEREIGLRFAAARWEPEQVSRGGCFFDAIQVMQVGDARDPLEGLLDLIRLAVDPLQIWPEDAHHEGVAGSCQDLVDSLVLTGECSVWLMNGTQVSSVVSLGTVTTDWILRN